MLLLLLLLDGDDSDSVLLDDVTLATVDDELASAP